MLALLYVSYELVCILLSYVIYFLVVLVIRLISCITFKKIVIVHGLAICHFLKDVVQGKQRRSCKNLLLQMVVKIYEFGHHKVEINGNHHLHGIFLDLKHWSIIVVLPYSNIGCVEEFITSIVFAITLPFYAVSLVGEQSVI